MFCCWKILWLENGSGLKSRPKFYQFKEEFVWNIKKSVEAKTLRVKRIIQFCFFFFLYFIVFKKLNVISFKKRQFKSIIIDKCLSIENTGWFWYRILSRLTSTGGRCYSSISHWQKRLLTIDSCGVSVYNWYKRVAISFKSLYTEVYRVFNWIWCGVANIFASKTPNKTK